MNPKDRSGSAKPNLSILPLTGLYEAALALYEGARKYGPWNWRDESVDETIYVDAAIRHLNQWLAGEDIDPDSGLPHISKAIAGLIILRDAQNHDCSIDTRPGRQNIDFKELAEKMSAINEKYPNPVCKQPKTEEAITHEWVQLRATGGNGRLHASDIGAPVRLRNAVLGKLIECESGTGPTTYKVETLQYTAKVNADGRYVGDSGAENLDDAVDVSQVLRKIKRAVPVPSTNLHEAFVEELSTSMGGAVSWSDTVAGGGSYILKRDDVGKRVELRGGQQAVIEDYQHMSVWPFIIETDDDDEDDDTATATGFVTCHADSPNETECEELPWDVVKVFHS